MKKINFKKGIILFVFAALLLSCEKNTSHQKAEDKIMTGVSSYTGFIPKDSANKMIGSYLASIGSNSLGESLYSLFINADELRVFLSDNNIQDIKISLAHTLEYINDGNHGQHAGYKSNALSIVISGVDADGSYVYAPGDLLPNIIRPCPPLCLGDGTATSNTLK